MYTLPVCIRVTAVYRVREIIGRVSPGYKVAMIVSNISFGVGIDSVVR